MFRKHSKNITQYLYQKTYQNRTRTMFCWIACCHQTPTKLCFPCFICFPWHVCCPPIFFAQRYSAESREIHIGKPLCSNRVDIAAGRKKQNSSEKIMKHKENDEENTAAPRKKTEMEIRKWKSLRQNRNSNQINQESAQALCTS